MAVVTTASAPRIAGGSVRGSVRSPRTISTPRSRSALGSVPSRTSARTRLPRARSASTTRPPRLPVAPTTRMGVKRSRPAEFTALVGDIIPHGHDGEALAADAVERGLPRLLEGVGRLELEQEEEAVLLRVVRPAEDLAVVRARALVHDLREATDDLA